MIHTDSYSFKLGRHTTFEKKKLSSGRYDIRAEHTLFFGTVMILKSGNEYILKILEAHFFQQFFQNLFPHLALCSNLRN